MIEIPDKGYKQVSYTLCVGPDEFKVSVEQDGSIKIHLEDGRMGDLFFNWRGEKQRRLYVDDYLLFEIECSEPDHPDNIAMNEFLRGFYLGYLDAIGEKFDRHPSDVF
jgi:hypothetical protein